LGAERAAHVESPRKYVDELAVPVAKRAVGTVPAVRLEALAEPTNVVAVTTLANVAFWFVSIVRAVTLAVCKAKLPVLSAVVTTAANGVVCAFIVDGI
jgi:hypothetical protein